MPSVKSRPSIDERLANSVQWHWKQDDCWRATHADLVRSYAGRTTYPAFRDRLTASTAYTDKEIENHLLQVVESYVMTMAANRPRALVTTKFQQYRPFAARFQRALDRYTQMLALEEVFQSIVRDACITTGVAYVHQSQLPTPNLYDRTKQMAGQPFVSRIPLKQLVRDTEASCVMDASFIGHIYTMPFDEAIHDDRFDKKMRDDIEETGPDGDRIRDDNQEIESEHNRIEDIVHLLNVYVRSTHEIRTYWVSPDFSFMRPDPLQVVDCHDTCPPYHFLHFSPVPDQFFPTSPAINLQLLVRLASSLYRKLEDQAQSQKNIGIGPKTEDLKALQEAHNGEWVGIDNANSALYHTQRFDGPDQNIFGMWMNTRQGIDRAGGNVTHRLGLGTSADTAAQEKMIGQNSSRQEAFYQQRFVSFARGVMRSLGRLVYEDAELSIPGTYQIPGSVEVPDNWEPNSGVDSRQGDYDSHYMVDIDPYSMAYKSPGDRAALADRIFMGLMQFGPMLAQMGVQPNLPKHLEMLARYNDLPELRDSFKFNAPPQVVEGPSGGGSANGGEYVHRNVNGSQQNPEAEILSMMQGANNSA